MTRERVPVRTILTTIGLVLATLFLLLLIRQTSRILVWMAVAAFFAVALYPVVNWVEARARWINRATATLIVYLLVVILIAGMIAMFVVPLAREAVQLANQAPGVIKETRAGRGWLGHLFVRYHVENFIRSHQGEIQSWLSGLGSPVLSFIQGAATTIAGILTIFVLSYLMVLQAPKIIDWTLALFSEEHAERIRRVGADCARTVTGYLSGNLLISLVCGVLTYVVLLIMGIPYAGLIALFVAIADLIPMVGATLGGAVAITAGFFHSFTAGIVVAVFYVLYQQAENHFLQPVIMSRTVNLNPLTVLVAVLVAAELSGLLGALLAIPIVGMIQVIGRDIWDLHRGRLKPEPTVGPGEREREAASALGPAPEGPTPGGPPSDDGRPAGEHRPGERAPTPQPPADRRSAAEHDAAEPTAVADRPPHTG